MPVTFRDLIEDLAGEALFSVDVNEMLVRVPTWVWERELTDREREVEIVNWSPIVVVENGHNDDDIVVVELLGDEAKVLNIRRYAVYPPGLLALALSVEEK